MDLRHLRQRGGSDEAGATKGEFTFGGCRPEGDQGIADKEAPDRITQKLEALVAKAHVRLHVIG